MNKINLYLVLTFILVISGCVTGSKTVKPSSSETGKTMPAIQEKTLSETPVTVSSDATESKNITETLPAVDNKLTESIVKIQYSQITNMLSELIDIKENSTVSGDNNYLGISENKLTIFEIKGNKDNIKEASMKLMYPKGIDKASIELNNAMMSRFLKNAAPEFLDWQIKVIEVLDKFNSITADIHGTSEENIALNNKIIKILYDKNANYIVVTLKTQP